MALALELSDFDKLFHNTKTHKVLINNIDILQVDQREYLNRLLISSFDETNISTIPRCLCGNKKGTFYLGQLCDLCNTEVRSIDNKGMNYLVWFKRSDDLAKIISPYALKMLDTFTVKTHKANVRFIQWLIDPTYRNEVNLDENTKQHINHILKQHGIEKNYNSFVENFEKVIDILVELHSVTNEKKPDKLYDFYNFFLSKKDVIFNDYLPFPNNSIIVTESTELGRYMDKSLLKPISAARRLTGLDIKPLSNLVKQNRLVKSLYELVNFYENYIVEKIFKKEGLVRQQIISTRSHFSCRAVITKLEGKHSHDEIHLPWVVAVNLFREHIINKLYRRGLNYREVMHILSYHSVVYSPMLDSIFRELIEESGGIKVFLNRNPSLWRGSIQTVRVTKVKNDITDNTISIPLTIMPAFNADFDGDELNITLVGGVNDIVKKESVNFEPHLNILTLTEENGFSSVLKYPKPVIATLSNFFNEVKRR